MTTSTPKLIRLWAWIIWLIAASFFFYDYLQQVLPSVIGQNIITEFHISHAELGIIASGYFVIYAILQIPIGSTIALTLNPKLIS